MDAKDIRNLQEAYMEVYNDLDEGASEDVAARSEKLAKQRKGQTPQRKAMYQGLALKARIRASGGNPGDKSQGHPLRRASNRPIHPHDSKYGRSGLTQSKRDERRDIDAATHGEYSDGPGTVTKNPKKLRKQKALGELGEQADLYDIILSHLLDEGYADTQQAAEAIMVNMSEEWRDSIVEEVLDEGEKPLPYGRMMKKSNQLADKGEGKRAAKIYLAANAPKGPKVKVRNEATAMAKRGYDEAPIRQRIAKSTGGGEAADKAKALADRPTYGDEKTAKARQRLARIQVGDFRKTTSSSPGLHGYAHKSDDPEVKAKQAARGAQRGALTPREKKQLGR